MATLKDHQQAMVDLLASGSGIPASAARLAHAMHDVLSAVLLNAPLSTDAPQGPKRLDAATPGLNDKALAADVEACRIVLTGNGSGPKATPAERRVKELENTIKQLRASNATMKQKLGESESDLQSALAEIRVLRLRVQPEQADCRKDDTQVCEHTWVENFELGRPTWVMCENCGAHK
jgi:hypothetical protein